MASNKKSIPISQQKILWGKAYGQCAMCKTQLVEKNNSNEHFPIGEHAHIEGEREGSARYNPNQNPESRNSYNNLILLCPTCHTKVDKNELTYTTTYLHNIKSDHEQLLTPLLQQEVNNVTFAELEVVMKFLANNPTNNDNTSLIPPNKKIKKNNLSDDIAHLITIGLIQSNQINSYINNHPDISYSDLLRNHFVSTYQSLKKQGYESDALFYAIWESTFNNSSTFKIKTAGLSVVTYFFEKCDIFEK